LTGATQKRDLACNARTRRTRPSRIRTRLGFHLPPLYVVNLESNPETQPSHINGWEGCPRVPRNTFSIIHPSARILERSTAVNTTVVNTQAIKSDKQDVGLYPTRESNLGKTCVPLCYLIAVEFAGSPDRTMIRKPSSMSIIGDKPRQGS
jgi:hypothetical protein